MERKRLDEDQLEENLKVVIGWSVKEEKLTKTFEFKSYLEGLVFASALGYRAEKMDHHPDMTIGYRKVTVAVNTHDVGGISHLDFELAREADGLFAA
jgi:4a-hydroxytetrahydrobiopterin dehydratase